MRTAFAALALGLLGGEPASASVTPLAPIGADETRIALAGDTAWFARGGRREGGEAVRVLAVPVDGSARATLRLRIPVAPDQDGDVTLGGSAQRVAALAGVGGEHGGTSQLYTGPPAGPLAPLGSPQATDDATAFFPLMPWVDGARVFVLAVDEPLEHVRFELREGPDAPAELLPATSNVVGVAGDLIAYAHGRGLTIRNWRTGAERGVRLPESVSGGDLRADGAAVLESRRGGIYSVSPAGAVRRVSRTGTEPRFAGDHVVYRDREGLRIAGPDANPRRFGAPTWSLDAFDADERRVLWVANGCLLAAPVSARAAAAPAAGPCPRTEVQLGGGGYVEIGRDRAVGVRLRCVAAPGACRGRVQLVDGSRAPGPAVRFSIPAGTVRRLSPRLTRATFQAARRQGRRGLTIDARVVTVDPDGRRNVVTGGYAVAVR